MKILRGGSEKIRGGGAPKIYILQNQQVEGGTPKLQSDVLKDRDA